MPAASPRLTRDVTRRRRRLWSLRSRIEACRRWRPSSPLPVERIGLPPAPDHEGVADEQERRLVHRALAGVDEVGESRIDPLIFGHRLLTDDGAIHGQLRAALL